MRSMLAVLLLAVPAIAVDYPIVYVRAPRYGDGSRLGDRMTSVPDVGRPTGVEPGTDLVRINPDGSETVLVEAGEFGAVLDPMRIDAQWVFYSLIPDARPGWAPSPFFHASGADIWKVNVATGEQVRLTNQEWTPNRGINKQASLKYPIYNTGPCPLPGGKVAFTSSRNSYLPVKGQTFPQFQLYLMDDDGKNVQQTGHLNLGSALHPTLLKDGRIMFSTYESQGHRAPTLWSLWVIEPDGRNWGPLVSAMSYAGSGMAWHFQSQWSDGDICVEHYYNLHNFGFGAMFGFPLNPPAGQSAFGHPARLNNPAVGGESFPFQRAGLFSVTPWTSGHDGPSPGNIGKVGMPSAAPNNEMLVCFSPGPANRVRHLGDGKPYLDSGIYLLKGRTTSGPGELVLIKNDPAYNELQPIALVPWEQIYGSLPPVIEGTPKSHSLLPPGTPFGLVGTSSFYARESKPEIQDNGGTWAWVTQGSDAGEYTNADIHAVRILIQEPTSHLTADNPAEGHDFKAVGNERLRVLGEVLLRKFDSSGNPVLDAAGDPDTSFLARIPADTSFTFQIIGKDGLALAFAQTWHQLRPGEIRHDCGGCHAHHKPGIPFEGTSVGLAGVAASKPDYQIADLTKNVAWTREFHRDVKPLFEAKCQSCHSGATPAAELVLDATFSQSGTAVCFGYSARTSKLITHEHATPLVNPLTAAERLTLGQWIDLGCQTDGRTDRNGVLFDDHRPTLFLSKDGRHLGAFDYMSGPPTVTLLHNGTAKTLPAPVDSVYETGLETQPGDVVVATATDSKGNIERIERTVKQAAPLDPQEEIDALKAQVESLTAEVSRLLNENLALKAKLADIYELSKP